MACISAARTIGSPRRETRDLRNEVASPCSGCSRRTIRPVSIRLQVEALTNSDSESPACDPQSPAWIFSAISLSAVAASGMRSSDSARHRRMHALFRTEGIFQQEGIEAALRVAGRADLRDQ